MATRRTPQQWPPIEIEYDANLTPLRFRDLQSGVVFTAIEGERGAAYAPDLVAATLADLFDRDHHYAAVAIQFEKDHPGVSHARADIDGVIELTAHTADEAVSERLAKLAAAANAERAKPTRKADVIKAVGEALAKVR